MLSPDGAAGPLYLRRGDQAQGPGADSDPGRPAGTLTPRETSPRGYTLPVARGQGPGARGWHWRGTVFRDRLRARSPTSPARGTSGEGRPWLRCGGLGRRAVPCVTAPRHRALRLARSRWPEGGRVPVGPGAERGQPPQGLVSPLAQDPPGPQCPPGPWFQRRHPRRLRLELWEVPCGRGEAAGPPVLSVSPSAPSQQGPAVGGQTWAEARAPASTRKNS